MAKHVPLPCGDFAIVDDEDYEAVSAFKWRKNKSGKECYPVTGHNDSGGVRFLHRVIMRAPKGSMVDHKNGDVLDNRKENLRFCSYTENARNMAPRGGTSRFKGVRWLTGKNRWKAEIGMDKRRVHIGYFTNEEDAARAYDHAALQHYGEFARTNF